MPTNVLKKLIPTFSNYFKGAKFHGSHG